MRSKGFEVTTISADGKEVADVIADGTKHIAIPLTRKITPFQDLICLLKLIKVIRQLKPEIIHTHTPKAGLLGMIAAWICRVPVRLHTVAGLPLMEATGMKRTILEWAENITYACAHRVYPNSKGLELFIRANLSVNPGKLKIIGKGSTNGIDTVRFTKSAELKVHAKEIRKRYGIGEEDIVFSFVGRIVGDKGIVELATAFQQFLNQSGSRKYFLLLIGDFEENLDPLPGDVMTFLKNNSSVIMPGFQSDIRPWVMSSDVFVFPSYREGFPNVVMQASLLEVPTIVSDINGCNEIITNGQTGLVVPPKNAAALYIAMNSLANNPAMRKLLASSARDFVSRHFKREEVWKALYREYCDLLSKTGYKEKDSRHEGSTDTKGSQRVV